MTDLLSLLGETRTEVIGRYVQRLTRETRNSLEDYSEDVPHPLRAVVGCAREINAQLGRAVVNRLESRQ